MKTKTTPKYLSNESVSKQLLKNKWLDKLTRTHISIPVSIFFLYAAGLLYWTILYTQINPRQTVLLFFVGTFFFTFVEYAVHRRVFHMIGDKLWKRNLTYKLHGIHHDYPKDKERLAMPPILSVSIATLLLGLFYLILNDYAFSFLAGFLVGYALYLVVHYSTHAFTPPNNFLKTLWVHHAIHHYQDQNVAFGVSSPLWDYIFGTLPKLEKRKVVVESAPRREEVVGQD